MYKILSLLFILFIFFSCSNPNKSNIIGSWQAVEVTEEGFPLEINPEEIRLVFSENNNYSYQSTLNYKEKGTYRIGSDLLFTIDTFNNNEEEKAVQIVSLSKDSLLLLMEEENKERRVKMVRK